MLIVGTYETLVPASIVGFRTSNGFGPSARTRRARNRRFCGRGTRETRSEKNDYREVFYRSEGPTQAATGVARMHQPLHELALSILDVSPQSIYARTSKKTGRNLNHEIPEPIDRVYGQRGGEPL